jgi:D-glycero-beta-D-manno-heptose 1-phosphate adenylyltransferase
MKKPDNIYMTFTDNSIEMLVKGLRRRGKRIVFTNGVFDILHFGHIDYLAKARAMGDVLIVGVNKDSSVKKFKSDLRPIQDGKDRARILASLRSVDYVVMFAEETPERLIKLVKPDVLVKGADYKVSEIVGADFVKSYGGHVKRITLAKGRSTTEIIEKIKKM